MTIEESIRQLEFLNTLQEQIRKQVRDSIMPLNAKEDNDFHGRLFVIDGGAMTLMPQLCLQVKVNGRQVDLKADIELRGLSTLSDPRAALRQALKDITAKLTNTLMMDVVEESSDELAAFSQGRGAL